MYKVLVCLPMDEAHRAKLERAGRNCCFTYCGQAELSPELVSDADVIIGNPPASMIGCSEKLQLLQLQSAGADPYLSGVLAPHTVLTNSTGAYSKAVAEHALALMLMLQKKLHLYRDDQHRALWGDRGTVSSPADAVIAVVGMGDIGSHFARMAKALGAYLIGVRRRSAPCPAYVDELYTVDSLDDVLPRADVIVSVLPGTAATRHLFTLGRFRRMKRSAVFINCGRGNSVAEDVLYEALSGHLIAAAGIDVSETEPLPADSPLWSLPELMITPHISGAFHLPETYERIVDIACENLTAFTEGRPLRNVVDLSTGYCR